jgi:hypothetical protein
MNFFDRYGKFSQYSNLWRSFTCGHLEYLLRVEYPDRNLPFQIRTKPEGIDDINQHLELDFTFVGVAYRDGLAERIPRIFRNSINTDAQAYTQIRLFVPRPRLIHVVPGSEPPREGPIGGIPGESLPIPGRTPVTPPPSGESEVRVTVRQSTAWHENDWDLLNQNWTLQLVPATSPGIPRILSTQPLINGLPEYQLPDLSSLSDSDFQWLSHH